MRTLATVFGFLAITCNLHGQDKLAFDVFDRLCKSLHLKSSNKPRLEIKNNSTSGASYSKLTNSISIDRKLIEGFSVLKEFQPHALAFVLGHELSHALAKDKHDTHFIAYDKVKGSTYQNEQNADIQGGFIAYIAGYNCAPILAETIETIYQTYQLSNSLQGYPDKADRIESIILVAEQVESLTTLFKGANLLLLADQYPMARALFSQIAIYYPSPECASNIAVTLMLDALNIGRFNYFNYTLPVEIAWDLRLKKPSLDLGQKDFEPEIIRQRELWLKKAELILKESLSQTPDYFKGWNNLICLNLIQNEIIQSIELIKAASNRFKSNDEQEQLRMLQGTAYLIQGNRGLALKQFKGIKSPLLNSFINLNLRKSNKATPDQNCAPVIKSLEGTSSTLLQEKTVKIDSLIITWQKDKFKITTPSKSILFTQVQAQNAEKISCLPLKRYDDEGIKWSKSLISILNQSNKRQVFYTVN